MISIIAAIDEKKGIGKAGKLPWHLSEDLRRFKDLTSGNTVIMGRNTYESIGKILPNRYNIVITRDLRFRIQDLRVAENFIILDSLENAIEAAKEKDSEEIFIIGGGQIFKEVLKKNLVNKLYLTLVEGDFNCDTFFPDYSAFTKEKFIVESVQAENGIRYKFIELSK